MEEISQVPQASPSFTPQNPVNNFSWRMKISKVFSVGIWIILFLFAPPTILVLLSQNSLPGDLFYPIKRGMENTILAFASVNPATRAAFRTDLTTTRFKEAQALLLSRSDTTGLTSFLTEIKTTQEELTNLSDGNKKEELTEKLLTKIDEYQSKLIQTESQIQVTNPAFIPPTPTPTLTSTPTPTPTILAQPTVSSPVVFSPTPTPTVFVSPTPTSLPPTVLEPVPLVPAEEIPLTLEKKEVVLAIDQTQKRLEEIKTQLSENRGQEKKEQKKEEKEIKREEKNSSSASDNKAKKEMR